MGLKPQYGGWAVVALVIALVIVVAGAIFTLCRRRFEWQWGRRNIWSICQEWRQRLSWLWAPREEKVGLVKAQHPTAQTVPGLYRQPGNTSQNLLHSESDLRLDAQGAFTRLVKNLSSLAPHSISNALKSVPRLSCTGCRVRELKNTTNCAPFAPVLIAMKNFKRIVYYQTSIKRRNPARTQAFFISRFEAVDRDLHPPLGSANAIPPQPLRPAPQPRATGRPRPSPLQAPTAASEYMRMMHESGPGPLTPPPVPPVPRLPGPVALRAPPTGGSVFLFQQPDEDPSIYGNNNPYKLSNVSSQSSESLRFDSRTPRSVVPESIQSSGHAMSKSLGKSRSRLPGMNFDSRYENRNCEDEANEADDDDDGEDDGEGDHERREAQRRDNPTARDVYGSARSNRSEIGSYRQFDVAPKDVPVGVRYALSSNGQVFVQEKSSLKPLGVNNNADRDSPPLDSSCDAVNEINNLHQHATKNGRVDGIDLHNSSAHRTIMESIYGPQAMLAKLHLQNSDNWPIDSRSRSSDESPQSIEMTPYLQKSSSFDKDEQHPRSESRDILAKVQQRVSQYIESLPDLADVYDTASTESSSVGVPSSRQDEQETIYRRLDDLHHDYHKDVTSIDRGTNQLTSDSPPPPPPAPPDVARDLIGHNSAPTTGERIFSALRSVTSQSYIDASEFYNSVRSSAQQQVPRFSFPTITRSTRSLIEPKTTTEQDDPPDEVATFHSDATRRGSDLYSPELNLEAHRTAQEVYNSLQDPPASPLLLRDLSQEPYPYMSDPSFTRTSEDIFNSIEQRRKSMERLNGLHEGHFEMEGPDGTTSRRRSSQDLYAALEEVQLKRRLSQNIDEPFGVAGWMSGLEQLGVDSTGQPILNRRGSQQSLEPEPPPDESNLRRAISCESVCSDTSVNLGDLENATMVGHVCVGLEYERWGGRGADCEGDLAVSVLEARDLVAPDGRPAQDTLARVCLLPDRETHVQTRLYRSSPSPSYQEKFLFPLDGGPIGRTLLVQIFSVEISIGGGASLLGEASLKLGPAARPPATTWLPLIGPGALPFPYHGELMFSLSYLPTAERLTLVVVKARNLRGANPSVPGDFFVKVYLLQQGKKMHKKRTTAKKGEKSPIFNEAIIFSVPPHALQTIQLRLTVAETDPTTQSTSKAFSVGHIIVGSTANGKSLAHWRHMLAALRRPVAMWHPLRK
ncbi:uncharacterized protein [Venturia canescens]|uniref:uncharacterized protein isoform X3 n=1 Tax=Venturia canescens TaxID=32260 RepID=UPI001C9BC20D|nr:uncharacterized protein LOC122419405 isoform X3 [Venturia canescens]